MLAKTSLPLALTALFASSYLSAQTPAGATGPDGSTPAVLERVQGTSGRTAARVFTFHDAIALTRVGTRLVEEVRWLQRWVRGDDEWEPPARPVEGEEDAAAVPHRHERGRMNAGERG